MTEGKTPRVHTGANPTREPSTVATTIVSHTFVDISELHDRVGDLALFIAQRFGVREGRQSGENHRVECPIHKPGHARSAHCRRWPDGRWTFRCHRCPIGPVDVIDLLVEVGEAQNRGDAIRKLGDELRLRAIGKPRLSRRSANVDGTTRSAKPMEMPDLSQRLEGEAGLRLLSKYTARRRWRMETAQHLDLHVVRRLGEARLRHPFTKGGVLYGAQDRSLGNSVPKWLTAKGSTTIPYNVDGLDFAARHDDTLTICEGPSDAITLLDLFGYEYPVIAPPGANVWMSEWTRAVEGLTVVLIGDNDNAGDKMRSRLSSALAGRCRVAQLRVPAHVNDLNDWRRESGGHFTSEFQQARDRAIRQATGGAR